MPCFRPASRALSHLLRHDPFYHHSSPAALFSRHSPLAPFTRAFGEPFFSSPFSSPLYTVYEMRDDNSHNNNTTKAEQQKTAQPEEAKAAEPQQQQQQSQQQRSFNDRLAHRDEDSHRQRWLDRRSNRRHRHNHSHHPLSLFSPFESLMASPFLSQSPYQPLEISVDLYSTPSAYQVNAAIPGVRKEDIKLTVEDGVLSIEAERREERGRPSKNTAAAPTSTSNPVTSASTPSSATPAGAVTEAPQAEQKAVEVEVKADGIETKAQQPQQQQLQQEPDEEDEVAVHHVESYYGRVQRSLSLPEDVDVEGLTAKYEDGVLRIELPRIEEKKQQVKQVNIQ